MIALALLLAVTPATVETTPAAIMAGPLDDWIAGDGGVPVALDDGSTLYLFGDTFTGPNDGTAFPDGWGFVNSSALHVDGDRVTPMLNLLRPTASTHYWIADGTQNADGSMWVVAHEVRVTDSWLFGFEVVDTDLFHVNDPLNVMSWRLAEKYESGWWDGRAAQFVDGTDLVVTQERGSTLTVGYDTVTGETFDLNAPDVGSLFIPVEHAGQWWAATYDFDAEVTTVWSAPTISGPWADVGTHDHDLPDGSLVYGSQVHVIDDVLTLQWSNNTFEVAAGMPLAALRPTYVPVDFVVG